MRSERQLKIGEEIRHALAAAIQRGDFHWPDGVKAPAALTVTEVRVSPDLKNATAFVMPLGGGDLAPIVRALNAGIGFFRHAVAQHVRLRAVPRLKFEGDTSFDYAKKIEDMLQEPEIASALTPKGE